LINQKFKSKPEYQDGFYDQETRLLRSMTIRESLHLWGKLQAAFEWQLQQSAPWFDEDHRNALIELQGKLKKLGND